MNTPCKLDVSIHAADGLASITLSCELSQCKTAKGCLSLSATAAIFSAASKSFFSESAG
jgi:hypothetical protein